MCNTATQLSPALWVGAIVRIQIAPLDSPRGTQVYQLGEILAIHPNGQCDVSTEHPIKTWHRDNIEFDNGYQSIGGRWYDDWTKA